MANQITEGAYDFIQGVVRYPGRAFGVMSAAVWRKQWLTEWSVTMSNARYADDSRAMLLLEQARIRMLVSVYNHAAA